mgnify:CR=1 FL=1
MKFGLHFGSRGVAGNPNSLKSIAQKAETLGYEHFGMSDHVIVATEVKSAYPYSETGKFFAQDTGISLEQVTALSFVSAATDRIRLLTSVMVLPHRHPVLAAKMLTTVDVLSKGRLTVGVGVGWMAEEFAALGVPFERRGKRTEEYIEAMRELWTSDLPTYNGEFVNFEGVHCQPRPANGTVPIIIGGHSKAAARRAGRLGDGFFPAREYVVELVDLVRRTAEEAGRDPDAVEIVTNMPEDEGEMAILAKSGVTRMMVPVVGLAGVKDRGIDGPEDVLKWRETIERYADL